MTDDEGIGALGRDPDARETFYRAHVDAVQQYVARPRPRSRAGRGRGDRRDQVRPGRSAVRAWTRRRPAANRWVGLDLGSGTHHGPGGPCGLRSPGMTAHPS